MDHDNNAHVQPGSFRPPPSASLRCQQARGTLPAEPALEYKEIPEHERRFPGPSSLCQMLQERPIADVARATKQRALERFFRLSVPASRQPFFHRNLKTALAAGRNASADPAAGQFTQDSLQPALVQTDLVGDRCRKLPQILIEKR